MLDGTPAGLRGGSPDTRLGTDTTIVTRVTRILEPAAGRRSQRDETLGPPRRLEGLCNPAMSGKETPGSQNNLPGPPEAGTTTTTMFGIGRTSGTLISGTPTHGTQIRGTRIHGTGTINGTLARANTVS